MARLPLATAGFGLAALGYVAVTAQFLTRFGMNPFAAAYGLVCAGLASTTASFSIRPVRALRLALQGGLACSGLAYSFVILRTFLTGNPSLYTLGDAVLAIGFLQAAWGSGAGPPADAESERGFRLNAALAAGGAALLGLLSLVDGWLGVALGFILAATGLAIAAKRGSWSVVDEGTAGNAPAA